MSKFGIIAICETLSYELKLMGAKIGVSVLCPGYVNTRIYDPERNRPADMKNDPNWESKVQAQKHVQTIKTMGTEGLKTGMDPKEVAEKVLAAVKEDTFYIYTHPEFLMAAQMRHEEILQQRNPSNMLASML